MDAPMLFGWQTISGTVGTSVAIVLTLFVFSYLLGDNGLFRLAEHLFVGLAIGYGVVVVAHSVLAPKLLNPLVAAVSSRDWPQLLPLTLPLGLGLLLLTKAVKRAGPISWLGSFSVALLLGVGAALAISGALLGTLLPQVDATANLMHYVPRFGTGWGLFSGLLVLVGVIGVLLHFRFRDARDQRPARFPERVANTWGEVGRLFIVIAFGALLATTFMSRLSLLSARVQFLLDSVRQLLGGWG